jgi:flagellar motility protein MotE (MotC chaperone)
LKNTIVYVTTFILAFIGTTAVIYTLNNKFVNIFTFDFRDAGTVEKILADSLVVVDSTNTIMGDSLLLAENVIEEEKENLEKKLNVTKSELTKAEQELSQKEKKIEQLKNQLEQEKVAEYEEWLKSTIKLYEAMETNKAADLLSKLPENEAREIIYSMKNKKAAEILSGLDTETIKRLTRSRK